MIDYYHFSDSSNASQRSLLIEIGVNNINGQVCTYTEYWNSNESLSPLLSTLSPYYGTNVNSSMAEQIALEYLTSRGYHFPRASLYIRTANIVGDHYSDSITYPVFEIVIRCPTNNVFPDLYTDGTTLQVSECSGRVTHFTHLIIAPPEFSNLPLKNPEIERRDAETGMQVAYWNESSTYVGSYLRLVPCLDPEDSFALSWKFEYESRVDNTNVYSEIGWNDAVSGEYLYPGLYHGVAYQPSDLSMAPFVIILTSLFIGAIAAFSFKRLMHK
jgi:hypothetical protein